MAGGQADLEMLPSTSLIMADTSGPQRFPIKLSNLCVCESGDPQRDAVTILAVKTLIMINLCGRHYVICFIISSEVKHDTLIYSYCEFNLYVEGLLAVCMCLCELHV